MGGFGPQELLIVGIIVLLFFGGKRLPEMFRGLGTGIREFKGALKDADPKQAIDDAGQPGEKPARDA